MAKIRVYELAKELGLDNKEILARLRVLKIPVKSHMSVVPEEEIERIKQSLAESENVSTPGGVEEKRVTRRVIRRRTGQAPPEPEQDQPKVGLATLKQAAKRARQEDLEEVSSKPETQQALEGIPEEWTKEDEKPKKKAVRKKKVPDKT